MRQHQLRTRAKICGITRLQDVQAVVQAGADAIGFVFSRQARVMSVLNKQKYWQMQYPLMFS